MIIQAFSLICLCLIVLAVISTKALRRGRRIWATRDGAGGAFPATTIRATHSSRRAGA